MRAAHFEDRAEAGESLGRLLKERIGEGPLVDPLVLAIPRGGIEVARPIARALNAELDVVLARKLRAPDEPELAVGAIAETGEVHLNPEAWLRIDRACIEEERRRQMAEIQRRRSLVRAVRPQAQVAGRSVIIVDDGVATGSTMIAAIKTVRARQPREIIVAVPVGPEDRLHAIRPLCDRLECLSIPDDFRAVGQAYRRFEEVSDERVVDVLKEVVKDAKKDAARPAHV